MRKRLRALHRNERGQIMVFGMLTILFVLVVGGLATDYAHLFVVDDELEKSMDACCLAGAGKLGFDDTAFPAARSFAREFAERNAYRAKGSIGEVRLDHDGNAGDGWQLWDDRPNDPPYGEITLGVWNPENPEGIGPGHRFAPSTDGTIVNAVMCRYKARLPTTLFGVWGMRFFNIGAMAIATSNPPWLPPQDACIFPIGLSECPFLQGGEPSSLGCGAQMTFITSSGQGAGTPPPGTNTASWVDISGVSDGEAPGADQTRAAIEAAASGACAGPGEGLGVESPIDTNNGMAQSVYNVLEDVFRTKFNESLTEPMLEVKNTATEEVIFRGYGWEVWVPLISSGDPSVCPPGPISGTQRITGWTRFVMTQVINRGSCAVQNPVSGVDGQYAADYVWNNDDGTCPASEFSASAYRGVFGYYECQKYDSPGVPTPVPRSALATKLRLVR